MWKERDNKESDENEKEQQQGVRVQSAADMEEGRGLWKDMKITLGCI